MTDKQRTPQRENIWVSIALNVVLPALILMKGARYLGWGPAGILILALSLPIAYFAYDLQRRGRYNLIAIIGFVSTLVTGVVGLLQLDKDWIAVKEAAVPGLYAVAILVSNLVGKPMVSALLLNPDFFDVGLIRARVAERGTQASFSRLMRKGTLLFAGSLFFSAVLNYILARIIITADSGTELFNQQLGRLQLLSYPIIAAPSLAIAMYAFWIIIKGVERDTGLTLTEITLSETKKDRPQPGQ